MSTYKKAPTLRQGEKIVVDHLTKEEKKILIFLGGGKGFPVFSLKDIQEGCFGDTKAVCTRGKEKFCKGVSSEFDRKKGTQYISGTSLTRNYMRRLHRLRLVERPKAKNSRGEYRITRKARGYYEEIKKAA